MCILCRRQGVLSERNGGWCDDCSNGLSLREVREAPRNEPIGGACFRCPTCKLASGFEYGECSCCINKRLTDLVAKIEAYGGTPDAMQATTDMVRQFETYRGQPPDYIDTPSGRIKLTAEPGVPTNRAFLVCGGTQSHTLPPVDSTASPKKVQFVRVDRKAEAEANGHKESDILKLGEPFDGVDRSRPAPDLRNGLGQRFDGDTIVTPWMSESRPVDPLDVEYDGVKLRELLRYDDECRREEFPNKPTRAQRAAISAHWSAQLRAKVAAAKAAERNVVTYCEEDEP